MKLPLQIFFNGLTPSVALEASVHRHAKQLEQFCSDIVRCRVHVGALRTAKVMDGDLESMSTLQFRT
jgi:hypothetical protein